MGRISGWSACRFHAQNRGSRVDPVQSLQRPFNQAKRRLVESDDAIKEVAQQVGYSDQFFFSKDFKKMTTLTPTQFRQTEGKA